MALTLDGAISETDIEFDVVGTVGPEIAPNYLFALDDEILQLRAFGPAPVTGDISDPKRVGRDPNHWLVERAVHGSGAASHDGVAVLGVLDAFVPGSDEDEPDPLVTAGGSFTPAAFVEPTTATPEDIANALINAGLMDGPP